MYYEESRDSQTEPGIAAGAATIRLPGVVVPHISVSGESTCLLAVVAVDPQLRVEPSWFHCLANVFTMSAPGGSGVWALVSPLEPNWVCIRISHPPSMSTKSNVDVCIIGAGPAGLMCANGLARAGVNVRVVDQR